MPSFDIVSEIDINQANNAVENAKRELETHYDFRGVNAKIELKKEKPSRECFFNSMPRVGRGRSHLYF